MSVLGAISTLTGKVINLRADRHGRLHVVVGSTPLVYRTSTAAALSLATTIGADYGRPARLRRIALTFSSAPTTSENITLTHNRLDPWLPASRLFTVDPSATAATSVINMWEEGGYDLIMGDEVTLAYTNTDTRTIDAEIVVELL